MWRVIFIGITILAIVIFGFSLADISGGSDVSASTRLTAPDMNLEGFARAIDPYDWQFPADFGPHESFQTEWWYYTGNLKTDSGDHFGFQFTIFRRAIRPEMINSDSEWRTDQIYMAHVTLSDIARERFYHAERFSRGGAGLAGATSDPLYHVWLEDWQVIALDDTATTTQITAATDDFSLDLTLEQIKTPALQGQDGLSPKSAEIGNASYYYTLSRLSTEGRVTIGDETYTVTGQTWKDHEFSTSALGENAQGWDWFGLIFDNDHELMIGQIRLADGGKEPAFGGLLIYPDGTTRYLPSETFTITPTDTWVSPHSGAEYPSGWEVAIDDGEVQLNLMITPLMLDQELHGSAVEYWEGAVRVSGDVTGYGYAELTGYVDTMQGRF